MKLVTFQHYSCMHCEKLDLGGFLVVAQSAESSAHQPQSKICSRCYSTSWHHVKSQRLDKYAQASTHKQIRTHKLRIEIDLLERSCTATTQNASPRLVGSACIYWSTIDANYTSEPATLHLKASTAVAAYLSLESLMLPLIRAKRFARVPRHLKIMSNLLFRQQIWAQAAIRFIVN